MTKNGKEKLVKELEPNNASRKLQRCTYYDAMWSEMAKNRR